MISTKLARAAQRATTAPAFTSGAAAAAQHGTQCICPRRTTHQRRNSSSKAAHSPSNTKPAPAAKAAQSDGDTKTPTAAAVRTMKNSLKKSGRRNSRVQTLVSERLRADKQQQTVADQFAGLPAVPELQHLTRKDYDISSFFSMHRPLSVTTTVPPPATAEVFNSIFESKSQRDPWENGNSAERRPEDVVFALDSAITALENATNSIQDEGMRWEVIQESPSNTVDGIKHLDGPPRVQRSLEELVSQFRPYNAPPPPQPFPDAFKAAEKKPGSTRQRKQQSTQLAQQILARPQQKSYQTTITVLEITEINGDKSYTASSTPIIRVPDPEELEAEILASADQVEQIEPPRIRLPFFERMQRRQRMYLQTRGAPRTTSVIRRAPSPRRVQMILISVKRQRKLKMKKHKYKKLMKRTRTLRRRQDRA